MILLDTNALLWLAGEDSRLGPRALEAVLDEETSVYFSPINIFEIETKRRSGKLEAPLDMLELARRNGYDHLSLDGPEAKLAGRLDWQHKDPFDRLLVAQAQLNGLRLMTADRAILDFESLAFDARL